MSRSVTRAVAAAWLPRSGVVVLALALLFVVDMGVARGSDTGPPYMGEVSADQATVYSQASRESRQVGNLSRGTVVAVVAAREGADGTEWVVTPDGFVPARDVTQKHDSWVAEVAESTAMLYGKPFTASGVRRTAQRGDLLRVTGISPGLQGDSGVWWATTEGFVRLRAIRPSNNEWAQRWTLPDPSEATQGWWGSLRSQSNVRAGSSLDAPTLGTFKGNERVKVLEEAEGQEIEGSTTWYRIDGGRYAGGWIHSSLVERLPDPRPNTPPPQDRSASRWIVVDRSASSLTYVEDGQAKWVTYVSLGEAGKSTPKGDDYGILRKYRGDRMSSTTIPDSTAPYDIPNVPFTQYFREGGYAIHGTYWHDKYGTPESQGCVNLTWTDGAYLFGLTEPQVPEGDNQIVVDQGVGTPVVVLD